MVSCRTSPGDSVRCKKKERKRGKTHSLSSQGLWDGNSFPIKVCIKLQPSSVRPLYTSGAHLAGSQTACGNVPWKSMTSLASMVRTVAFCGCHWLGDVRSFK